MEKQTKHRILGIVVLIGLVVILLPFFQSRKELRTDTSIVKAPPFPEQSVPSITSDGTAIPLPTEQEPENPAAADKVSQQPDDTIQIVTPPASAPQIMPAMPETNTTAPQPEETEKKKVTQLDPNDVSNDDLAPAPVAPSLATEQVEQPVIKQSPAVNKPVVVSAKPVHQATANLVDLKESTWVVQMGSFKNKENALHLVNKLRASGYRAFHQEMTTATGTSTRVFVGPENKRNSARIMAIQLEKDLNLHGVILNYKPLDL